jgi:undecaprenyl-diphosphatase
MERHEHPLLLNRRLDLITFAVLLGLTIWVYALAWVAPRGHLLQPVDDAVLRWMVGVRSDPLTAVAKVLNVLGSVWVTLPVRLVVVAYLAIRRRWWHAAAFAGAVIVSEVLVGLLKGLYDRPRPPGSLVETSGGSFPSGHAMAASVTVVALVIALFPPGAGRRWAWGVVAVLFSLLMALSRAYLAAHWASDAVAGVLLGTTIALGSAVVVEMVRAKVDPDGWAERAEAHTRPRARSG